MTRQHTRPRAIARALLIAAALVLPASSLAPSASAAEPTGAVTLPAEQASAENRSIVNRPAENAAIDVHGLKGEYFSMSAPGARDFAELGGTSLDPQINFPGLAATFEALTGRAEHTTARWTGAIEPPATGAYTFHGIGDNGFRLFIDGEPVIDHWVGDWDKEQTSAPVELTAGQKYDFRLEMFQDVGGANMFLRWSTPTLPKQLVPDSAFTPPADFEVYPVELSVPEDGRRLRATFENRVGDIRAVKDHLKIEADTTAMPIRSVAVAPGDPKSLIVTLAEPIQKSQQVKVVYDGEGGLKNGDETVPEIIRYAQNRSTHRLLTHGAIRSTRRTHCPSTPARNRCAASGRTSTVLGSSAVPARASSPSSAKTSTRRSSCRSRSSHSSPGSSGTRTTCSTASS